MIMKKRILIFSIVIVVFLISIMAMNYYTSNAKTFTQDGVTYALTLDGNSVNSFPSKGMYRVDVTCNNAMGRWLYEDWNLAVENITGNNATCNIDFVTIFKTYLNNYIIDLTGQDQGKGQVVNENGYRYEGKNPNNYVWFNNELWRIIGVFDSASHGQSGKNLVKIIRNESIGQLMWNNIESSDWSQASLKNLLNGAYLNAQNGTDSEYCWSDVDIPGNCDYTIIGINITSRTMIANANWPLGGSNIADTPDNLYINERGTNVYGSNATEWTGKIGIMYASDYGYSVLASSCARTTRLDLYATSTCAGESWIYSLGAEWLLTPKSNHEYMVYYLSYSVGFVDRLYPNDGKTVRPTLYLDSSVYVIDGNGTMADPYIIGM